MSNPSLSRQIAALDALIAVIDGRKPRPRPTELQMLVADAKAGLETLRREAAKIEHANRWEANNQ